MLTNAFAGFEGMIDSTFKMAESRTKQKRAVADRKFLEVMVVIDETVIQFHGEQHTELFILAIFNMVCAKL